LSAVDRAEAKLVRQVRKLKTQRVSRPRNIGGVKAPEGVTESA
jgi:ribosome-associated translation inhibitor RaiA